MISTHLTQRSLQETFSSKYTHIDYSSNKMLQNPNTNRRTKNIEKVGHELGDLVSIIFATDNGPNFIISSLISNSQIYSLVVVKYMIHQKKKLELVGGGGRSSVILKIANSQNRS